MFLAASKCCRTKLFEIKQQHELCVRQKFSISGRYNKYQATFPTHTHPSIHCSLFPLCHCLWQYRCICFMGVRIQRVVPASLLPLLPSLPAKSFESNANTVCESMILFPLSLLSSTTPSLTWCVCVCALGAYQCSTRFVARSRFPLRCC